MPSLSFSSGSSMPRATANSRLLSAMMGKGSEQQADSSQLYARISWLGERHIRHLELLLRLGVQRLFLNWVI